MDFEDIESLCSEDEIWRDVPLTYRGANGKEKTVRIPLILTCMNGIYVLFRAKTDIPDIYRVIRQKFGIRDGLYCFINEEDAVSGALYDPAHYNFIEIDDFRDGFETFFYNHLIPQSELHFYDFRKLKDYLKYQEPNEEIYEFEGDEDAEKYIRPFVSDSNLEHIIEVLTDMEDAGYMDGNYMIMPDGSMQVKKTITTGKTVFSDSREFLFPCEDEDGDKAYLVTLLGGWFGLHKFKRGKWGQGLLYLLTCGVGGVFYIYDLIMLLVGNYHDKKVEYNMEFGRITQKKQRIYARPVKNKKKFALTVPIALLLSMVLTTYVYMPAMRYVSSAISNIAQQSVQDNVGDYVSEEDLSVLDGLDIDGIENIFGSINGAE